MTKSNKERTAGSYRLSRRFFTICPRLDILPVRMGRKLRGVSGQEAIKAFEKFGYRQRKRKGSHVNLVKTGSSRLTIPLHSELSVGLLANEIKKAGLNHGGILRAFGEVINGGYRIHGDLALG
jgi:predicted RNA binding protein YcfA (HicA-like mRNA interferase family)